MIRKVIYLDEVFAIIMPNEFNNAGVTFVTENHYSQQLGYMRHPQGKIIQPHIHNPAPRNVEYTQEVLLIKKGKLKVNFYNNDKEYLESATLSAGDVILLIKGGHGFEVLEEIEMIEVKQGPYVGDHDKTRFIGIEK